MILNKSCTCRDAINITHINIYHRLLYHYYNEKYLVKGLIEIYRAKKRHKIILEKSRGYIYVKKEDMQNYNS